MRSFVARPGRHFKPEARALNSQNLVFLLRMGLGRTSGRPKSRAFVDFLFAQFPEKNSAIAGPHDVGSRIVIPQELISRCLSIKKSLPQGAQRGTGETGRPGGPSLHEQGRLSEAPHHLPACQRRQKFSRGFPEFGMARLRSNLD